MGDSWFGPVVTVLGIVAVVSLLLGVVFSMSLTAGGGGSAFLTVFLVSSLLITALVFRRINQT